MRPSPLISARRLSLRELVLAKIKGTVMSSPPSSSPSTSNGRRTRGPPTRGPVRMARTGTATPAGSNWQALKKTLESDSTTTSRLARKRKAPSVSGSNSRDGTAVSPSSSLHKGKARQLDGGNAKTGSPAPTSLPWFAEDLSPEDLALVRNLNLVQQQDAASGSTASSRVNGWDVQKGTDAQEERKKQVILGGNWDGPEYAAKREPGTYVAIDCEMVGVGIKGSESVLARVSIVNFHGHTLLDRFVKPQEKVTDYRTFVSGIRAKDLAKAPSFETVQKEVADMIKDRVLVGHAIQNDLKALLLDHPRRMIRDTATFQPLRDLAQTKFPGLRKLADIVLGIDIQKKGQEHSSVEDARTTMAIFRTQKEAWDKTLRDEQASIARKQAKKAARLGVTGDGGDKGAKAASSGAASAPGGPLKRKTNQATPNWWASGDW